MKRLGGAELRQAFLGYFARRGHAVVPSSPLVPQADPTLLFTNAGMVQFKDVFLGVEKRAYNRATTCQKCVRAGGKHNDLENVGITARHHTFFEMLGNFSFGDYFKEKAIEYGWGFLTVDLGLPADRLWATIYQADDEAFTLWQKVAGLPESRIVRLGEKDNFWAMGDTGPCGPCSEMVIDQGPAVGCGRPTCGVGCDCDRYLELWNLVFMQFERGADGRMTPLPRPSIDTGAGLERISAILQGVPSNFDTDLIRPAIRLVEELTGQAYGRDPKPDVSMRVIADHARAATFLMTDGVLPSNEGRGYVLRRIVRRALRHGKLLGLDEPFLTRIMAKIVEIMGAAYPELEGARERVLRETVAEEERFGHTLRTAIPRLEELIAEIKQRPEVAWQLTGEQLFKLYDTYGLPRDIVDEIAQEQGVEPLWDDFERRLDRQRNMARVHSAAWFKVAEIPAALRELSAAQATRFLGHECPATEATVIGLLKAGVPVEAVPAGEEADGILDATPFYGEAGGQVADTGRLEGEGLAADVRDVQKPLPGLFVHAVRVRRGTLRRGDRVRAEIDADRRAVIAKNHTATHLLHEALHRVLGDHVRQEGSLVAPDRLRFDFRHFGPLTAAEVSRVERLVNEQLWRNLRVMIEEEVPYDEALRRGARAFFADKYGDRVRVVSIPEFGLELCGGTHVAAIGEIGIFKIAAEGGVAAGVRRIEAYSGPGAYDFLRQEEEALRNSAEVLKARPLEVPERLDRLTGTARDLEREVQRLRARLNARLAGELAGRAQMVGRVQVVAARVEELDLRGLRELGDQIKARLGSGVVILGSAEDGRVAWVAMVTGDLVPKVHAGKIVREVARITDGSGGGRPELAEAGGKDPSRIDEALRQVSTIVRRQIEGS